MSNIISDYIISDYSTTTLEKKLRNLEYTYEGAILNTTISDYSTTIEKELRKLHGNNETLRQTVATLEQKLGAYAQLQSRHQAYLDGYKDAFKDALEMVRER